MAHQATRQAMTEAQKEGLAQLEMDFSVAVMLAAVNSHERKDVNVGLTMSVGADCAFQAGLALALDHPALARQFQATIHKYPQVRAVEIIVADLVEGANKILGRPK